MWLFRNTPTRKCPSLGGCCRLHLAWFLPGDIVERVGDARARADIARLTFRWTCQREFGGCRLYIIIPASVRCKKRDEAQTRFFFKSYTVT